MNKLENKLQALPKEPGVYEMLDAKGKIIYVGKAINLKNRVSSYFKGKKDSKTTALVEKIEDISWTITSNELEALILEGNLIKENRPKYNIILRDDKHYPYLKIDLTEQYPKLQVVRRKKNDGAIYFGPYPSIGSMRTVLNTIQSLFPLRTCSNNELKNRSRPCLQYQIKRCLAPCTDYISQEEYHKLIEETILLLKGKEKELIRELEQKMKKLACEMEFEKAAKVRDQLEVIKKLALEQIIDQGHAKERDIIGFCFGETRTSIMVFYQREGNIANKEAYFLEHLREENQGAITRAFLEQHYGEMIPARELVVDTQKLEPGEKSLLEEFLSYRKGRKVVLTSPKVGEKKKLLQLAQSNAAEKYRQKVESENYLEREREKALEGLKSYLDLRKIPKRIECYDISNISGTDTVASMAVFVDGQSAPSEYRKFKIRGVEGPNDFLAMEEVIRRRFKQDWPLPDLVLIDGGKGQLSSAVKIIRGYGLAEVEVCSLAKKEELVFKEGLSEGIFIPRKEMALKILQGVRDEAHRFAITYHRTIRDKKMTASVFDEIEGLGPKKKKALLKEFNSLAGVRKALVGDIAQVVKSRKLAEKIKDVIGDE